MAVLQVRRPVRRDSDTNKIDVATPDDESEAEPEPKPEIKVETMTITVGNSKSEAISFVLERTGVSPNAEYTMAPDRTSA